MAQASPHDKVGRQRCEKRVFAEKLWESVRRGKKQVGHLPRCTLETVQTTPALRVGTPSECIEAHSRILSEWIDGAETNSYDLEEACWKTLRLSSLLLDNRWRSELVNRALRGLTEVPCEESLNENSNVFRKVWSEYSKGQLKLQPSLAVSLLSRGSNLLRRIPIDYSPASDEHRSFCRLVTRSRRLLRTVIDAHRNALKDGHEVEIASLRGFGKRLKELDPDVVLKYPSHLQLPLLLSESNLDQQLVVLAEAADHHSEDLAVLLVHFPEIFSTILNSVRDCRSQMRARLATKVLWLCFGVNLKGLESTDMEEKIATSVVLRLGVGDKDSEHMDVS